MKHLSPQELIDVAEGGLAPERASHLEACAACRRQVVELRVAWQLAREVQVPEPSPLFWDHFSERVRSAIAAEPAGDGATWWVLGGLQGWSARSRRAWPLTLAAAAVAIMLALVVWRPAPTGSGGSPTVASLPVGEPEGAARIEHAAEPDAWPEDDPALNLVVDLTGSLDWEEAQEAGLTISTDSAEHAVWHLSDEERRELARLLKAELGRPRS